MQHSSPPTSQGSRARGIQDDPSRMRAVLQEHLKTGSGSSPTVMECRITNQRQRDGSRGTVQFDLRLRDPETGATWDQIVTGLSYGGQRTLRVWDVIRTAQERHVDSLPDDALQPFTYVPELDLLLQVFPHDHRLPALATIMAGPPPHISQTLLQEFGPGSWRLQSWAPKVVQYRPDMRAIVRVDITAIETSTSTVASRRYFAKIYRDPEQARAAHHAQSALHQRVAESRSPLGIAKPALFSEELRLLVTEAVPGISLTKIIRRSADPEPSVRLAARAVAAFHQLDVTAPPRPAEEELTQLREAAAHLTAAFPSLADTVATMVDLIDAGLAEAPAMLIHGDLKPDHILIDDERVTLIDFDLMGAADPVIDVAHLIAFLGGSDERAGRRGDGANRAAQAFLDEYFSLAPAAWRGRLRPYHATTSMHKAVGLSRRSETDRRDLAADVLQEGLAILTGDTSDAMPPSFKRRLTRSRAQ